ncbi:GumC family protein, partial [Alienimonas chondri]|uniref:GumC family protein n=1 Tax=Alienimonas chondri TaxID=2681879 RepID=UPI0014882469
MQIPPPEIGAPFDPIRPLRLVILAVRRCWKRMLGFFVAAIGIALVGLYFAPREYGSDAKLFVRVGRETVGLDPTVTTAGVVSLNDSRKTEMNSVLDVIATREVFERTAERVGPEVVLEQGGWSPLDPVMGVLSMATGGSGGDGEDDPELDRIALREEAVRALSKSFQVDSSEDSSVIEVSCVADSPELARTLLKAFLDSFQSVYLEMYRTNGSYEFFETQVAELRRRYERSADLLREAKDTIGAATVDGRRASLQHQIEQIEDRVLLAEVERDAEIAARDALRSALEDVLNREDSSGTGVAGVASGSPDDAADALRKQVQGLELREQELLTRFTEQHPEVIAVRDRLVGAKSLLSGSNAPGDPEAVSTDPTFQGLHLRSLERRVDREALDRRLQTLRSQLEGLQADLRTLNGREAEVNRLQGEVALLAAKYTEYSERLEQARLDRDIAAERITNVNVVQPPTFVLKPVSPRKPLVLAAAFVLGCVGAGAIGLLNLPTDRPAVASEGDESNDSEINFEPVDEKSPVGAAPPGAA